MPAMKSEAPTLQPPSKRISKLASRNTLTTTDACVPVALVSRNDVAAAGLDARALFMFGFIDDRSSVFELMSMSGLPLTDAAEALAALCDVGAVALVEERAP
jgi:hypothetical protein